MKKLVYVFTAVLTAFLLLGVVSLQAQDPTLVKTWDFEVSMDNWASGGEGSSIALSTEQAASGTQSLKLVKPASGLEINLQNDAFKDLQEGDVLSLKVWLSAADQALVNGAQIFWQTGAGWSWNSAWNNGSDLTGGAWTTIQTTLPAVATPLQRIGLQLLLQAGNEAMTPALYVDDITVSRPPSPLVSNWGLTDRGTGWPILNDSTTVAGNASMGDPAGTQNTWHTIRGEFPTLEASTDQAVVVSGKLEYVGGDLGSVYGPLRYALTFQDSTTLQYQYTDSAMWVSSKSHFGYEFTPRTGNGTQPNGGGGNGSVWTVAAGGWNSTYSNNGRPLTVVPQAPRNAEIVAGVYDWAISVQAIDDTTNEVRWYLVGENNNKYWFGGAVVDTAISTQFNGICFGIGDDLEETGVTEFNVTDVKAELGDPIVVPEAPFEPFYVDAWGRTVRGTGWPVLNDSTYLDGNASIGDPAGPQNTWHTIRGGFWTDIQATTEKAIIVKGQMEYVGGDLGSVYGPLRFALTYQDSATLNYQYTDSAMWSSTKGHFGYEFTPRTGNGTQPNGGGGNGSVWTVTTGGWNSTYSNGGGPLGVVQQAPRNAIMTEGVYDWAVSVQPLGDGTNEIRWYLEKDHSSNEQTTYWIGGTFSDTSQVSTKFNSIAFGIGDDLEETGVTQFNVIDCYVDLGNPIVVPEAPFEPFYVDAWGRTVRGAGWPVLNDSTTIDGNASMGDPAGTDPNGWQTIRGGFWTDVQATTEKAIIVKGQMEYIGGDLGSVYGPLRFALTYQDSATLNYQYTDSAMWSSTQSHFGYEFTPRTGNGTQPNGGGGNGSVWTVTTGGWNSTYSNGGGPLGVVRQAPRNAVMTEGVYDWAVSVQPLGDGTNEIRWYLEKEHSSNEQTTYWIGGTFSDSSQVSTKFNSIAFGIGDDLEDTGVTQFNVIDCLVDLGNPIVVPPAPFEAFYVEDWGFIGDRTGGWHLTPSDLVGNVEIGGDAPTTDWAAVLGGFGTSVAPTTEKALVVTGKIILEGGGFETSGSLRFSVFNNEGAGSIDSTDAGYAWNGTDDHSYGYLFLPQEGNNGALTWQGIGQDGTYGAVVDGPWLSTEGANSYIMGTAPQRDQAVGGAGTYNFAMSVAPQADGTQELRFKLIKDDDSYIFSGISVDSNDPLVTDKFNSVGFALNTTASTTTMKVEDLYIDLGAPIEVPEGTPVSVQGPKSSLPTVFSLSQNYPNPFNPVTTIEFGLPQSSEVKLVVHDIMGRVVTELASGNFAAGYHKINFNASHLASGIYFYKLEAGKYVSVRKLTLLK